MLELKIEKVGEVWKEALPLMREEHKELQIARPFAPDLKAMKASEEAGIFKVLVARVDGRLVGYLSWMIDFDMESYGTLIAHQCAWYVRPGVVGVGHAMFVRARLYLRGLGVKFVYWHHPDIGRGKDLGVFFERAGCQKVSTTYEMVL